ncbi:hypothetical protein FRC01_007314, partial [Tulasnella sp. 417]
DGEEHGRLDVQHEMLKAALGGLYARQAGPAVRRALTIRKGGDPNAILDIGTGSGCWVIDMAKQYPHAEAAGMDLVPPNFVSPPPANTRFECDDANHGLSQYFPESFDVVHSRCITIGITDYRSLLEQAYNLLRPGGVLLTVDCDMLAYDENHEPIPAMNEDEPKRNPNANAYLNTSKWIKEMGEMQGERVNRREFIAAQLMQEDFLNMGAALRPLLLASGNAVETVDRWIREQEEEVREMKKKLYFKTFKCFFKSFHSIKKLPGHEHIDHAFRSYVMHEETASQSSGMASRSESPFGATDGSVIAPSSPGTSVYSYASSVDKHLILKELHGRIVNNTNDTALHVADGEEHGRLDVQHEMLKAALGGLYIRQAAPAVRRALAFRTNGDPNAILDIGTGSGCWIIDMAKQFPHTEAVGLDLVPPNFVSPPPDNTRFECDDANHGLSQYFPESFDVVHSRCITMGITDYQSLLREAYNVLRPGGVLLTVDCDMIMYNENQEPFPAANEGEPGFSWMDFVINTGVRAILNRSPGAKAYLNTSKWIKEMGETDFPWDESGERVVWVPLGPWTKELQGDRVNRREFIAAQLIQEDFASIGRTLRPALVASGNPVETVDRWIREQEAEVREMKVKIYMKVNNIRVSTSVGLSAHLTFLLSWIAVDLHLGREEESSDHPDQREPGA